MRTSSRFGTVARRAGAVLAGTLTIILGMVVVSVSTDTTPRVAITNPADGTVVSRSATPSLPVNGTVEFDTPVPTERTYYAGELGDPGLLSLTPTGGEPDGQLGSVTPLNEALNTVGIEPEPDVYETIVSQDQVPFTLDASRPLTGVVTLTSVAVVAEDVDETEIERLGGSGGVGVGASSGRTVEVTVTAEEVGGEVHALGTRPALGNTIAHPVQHTKKHPWAVELPAELDKRDFTGQLTLTVVVRGANVLWGFTVPDETNLTVPTYSASFDRRVETAIDDGPFTTEDVTGAEDGTTWAATIPTPPEGTHAIAARAVQGQRTSPTETVTIDVIE